MLVSFYVRIQRKGIFQSELEYDGWLQLRLWHAFNDDPVPVFTERGNVTVSSVRSGASVVGQNGLLPAQINALKNLAEHDGKYRLKALARISSGSEIVFLTSVPAVNKEACEQASRNCPCPCTDRFFNKD